ERRDQGAADTIFERKHARAEREEGIEGKKSRRAERNPEEQRLAEHVLRHPATLGGLLPGTELAVRIEESGIEDGDRIYGEAVSIGERGKLRPREVRIG